MSTGQRDYSKVPAELQERPQWVNWKLVKEPDGKTRKVPIQPSGREASTTDDKTWSTFDQVVVASPRFSGIGYVFAADDPYCGIDLDGVRDPGTGSSRTGRASTSSGSQVTRRSRNPGAGSTSSSRAPCPAV